jgi:hypothetical protein
MMNGFKQQSLDAVRQLIRLSKREKRTPLGLLVGIVVLPVCIGFLHDGGYGDEKEVMGYFFGSLGLLSGQWTMLECSPPLEIARMIINNQKVRNNG